MDFGSNAQPGGEDSTGTGIPGSVSDLAGFNAIIRAVNSYGKVLVADFNGDGALDILSPLIATLLFNASSSLFLNRGGLSIGLTASAAFVSQNTAVTLTATLAPTMSAAAATGNVSFFANGVALGSVPVSANAASFTLNALPQGKDTITASYGGTETITRCHQAHRSWWDRCCTVDRVPGAGSSDHLRAAGRLQFDGLLDTGKLNV